MDEGFIKGRQDHIDDYQGKDDVFLRVLWMKVENILHRHPKILKAAVVGMPDYRLGEKVCAYIIPREGEAITLEEVTSFMESQ